MLKERADNFLRGLYGFNSYRAVKFRKQLREDGVLQAEPCNVSRNDVIINQALRSLFDFNNLVVGRENIFHALLIGQV